MCSRKPPGSPQEAPRKPQGSPLVTPHINMKAKMIENLY